MITQTWCNSFKKELFEALHNFTPVTGDTFKIALYTGYSNIGADTTVYTSDNEIVAAGYPAGGVVVTPVTPGLMDGVGFVTFVNLTIATALTARAALIYNSTNGDRAVCVLDFGADRTSTTSFQINFPPANANEALLRIE